MKAVTELQSITDLEWIELVDAAERWKNAALAVLAAVEVPEEAQPCQAEVERPQQV